jgi:hypothetical protein
VRALRSASRSDSRKAADASSPIWRSPASRLAGALIVAVMSVCVTAQSAAASLAPGLCHSNQSRGSIPRSFAIHACFDGKTLYLYNNLDIAMGAAALGAVGSPKRSSSDFGLAADATRLVSSDTMMLLPGDELSVPIGAGAAKVKLRGTPKISFYALASSVQSFIPSDTAGVLGAFTDLIKDTDAAGKRYDDCKASHKGLRRQLCKASLASTVTAAAGRFIIRGGLSIAKSVVGKIANVLVGSVDLARWANKQTPQVRALLDSGTISLAAVPSATLTQSGVGALQLGARLSSVTGKGLFGQLRVGCPMAGTSAAPLGNPMRGFAFFSSSASTAQLVALALKGGVVTDRGVRIGSSANAVLRAYPGSREVDATPGGPWGPFLFQAIMVRSAGQDRMWFMLDRPSGKVSEIDVPRPQFCD